MENVFFKQTGNVAILPLNKPGSFNSLDIELSADFLVRLLLCRETKGVQAIVIKNKWDCHSKIQSIVSARAVSRFDYVSRHAFDFMVDKADLVFYTRLVN